MRVWVEIDYCLLVVGVENIFKGRELELYFEWKGVWLNEYGLKGKEEVS